MEETSVNAAAVPWESPAGYPEGLTRKVLRMGPDGRPRAALLKLAPGFSMDAHTHDLAEVHYVLEGMYESHGHEHAAGSYRYIPAHQSHGPAHSKGGALLLVHWEG